MATFEQFAELEIKAGRIIKAEAFPRARKPAYKVWVDFGEKVGIKQTSAQITDIYKLEDLPGRRVLGLVNIGTRNIAGFVSEFLLLGFHDDQGRVHLATYEDEQVVGATLN